LLRQRTARNDTLGELCKHPAVRVIGYCTAILKVLHCKQSTIIRYIDNRINPSLMLYGEVFWENE
jgi:hypothetical protein